MTRINAPFSSRSFLFSACNDSMTWTWTITVDDLASFLHATKQNINLYLADLCQPVASVGSRQRLRSATRGDLVISPTAKHFDARSFAVAGPKAWSHLPADIRAIDTISAFKTALKTFLFRWLFVHPVAYTSRPCNRFMLRCVRNCCRYYYYYYYYY